MCPWSSIWLSVCPGPGVSVRGFRGTLLQPSGCALRLAAAARQRLWTGPCLAAGVALRARARHPSPGAGQRSTRRSLARTWPKTILRVLHSVFLPCHILPSYFLLQAMEGSMLTLSLANWMELPGLKLKDWMRDKRRFVSPDLDMCYICW